MKQNEVTQAYSQSYKENKAGLNCLSKSYSQRLPRNLINEANRNNKLKMAQEERELNLEQHEIILRKNNNKNRRRMRVKKKFHDHVVS
jgi:gamma-glutamylcysteine synthetase